MRLPLRRLRFYQHVAAEVGSSSIPQSVVVPKYTIVDLGANVSPSAINSSNEVVGSVGSGNGIVMLRQAQHDTGTIPRCVPLSH
jgi:hypothetical protein